MHVVVVKLMVVVVAAKAGMKEMHDFQNQHLNLHLRFGIPSVTRIRQQLLTLNRDQHLQNSHRQQLPTPLFLESLRLLFDSGCCSETSEST